MAYSPVMNRFLHLITVDTHAVDPEGVDNPTTPSNPAQSELIDTLVAELVEAGLDKSLVSRTKDTSAVIVMPATEGMGDMPHVAFSVHVDTYPGQPGVATPTFHTYQGGDIELLMDGLVITADELKDVSGQSVITSTGDSLLGGDDKAGIAIQMEVILKILRGEIAVHGPLTFIFSVDEEIGKNCLGELDKSLVESWDVFYTLDGLQAGSIDIGCFYGAKIVVDFKGHDGHPGIAGHKLHSAMYAACGLVADIGHCYDQPWNTEGEDGFVYVAAVPVCTPNDAKIVIIPRYFDREELDGLEDEIREMAEETASSFGCTVVVSEMEIDYVSTEEAVDANPEHVLLVNGALEAFGLNVLKRRVRGGTVGAMLNMTHPDIPAINLGVGYGNCHERTEFLDADGFETMERVVVDMIRAYTEWEMDE